MKVKNVELLMEEGMCWYRFKRGYPDKIKNDEWMRERKLEMLLLWVRMCWCKVRKMNWWGKESWNRCCIEQGCLDEKEETAEGKIFGNNVALSKDVLTKDKNAHRCAEGKKVGNVVIESKNMLMKDEIDEILSERNVEMMLFWSRMYWRKTRVGLLRERKFEMTLLWSRMSWPRTRRMNCWGKEN